MTAHISRGMITEYQRMCRKELKPSFRHIFLSENQTDLTLYKGAEQFEPAFADRNSRMVFKPEILQLFQVGADFICHQTAGVDHEIASQLRAAMINIPIRRGQSSLVQLGEQRIDCRVIPLYSMSPYPVQQFVIAHLTCGNSQADLCHFLIACFHVDPIDLEESQHHTYRFAYCHRQKHDWKSA